MRLLFQQVAARKRIATAPSGGGIYLWPTVTTESELADTDGYRWKVRAPSGYGSYTTVKTVSSPSAIGTDLNATTYHAYNTQFGGIVVAYNEIGESSITYDEIIFHTAPAGVISDLTADALAPDTIGLTWSTDTPPTWGGFRVQVSSNGTTGWETLGTVMTGDGIEDDGVYAFAYNHTGLPEVAVRFYRVIPYNSNPSIGLTVRPDSEAAASNVDSATTTSSGYVIRADFENGNIENGISGYWTTSGTLEFNNTDRVIHSGKCVRMQTGSELYRNFTAMDTAGFFIAGAYLSATSFIAHIGILNVFMDGDTFQIRSHPSFTVVASRTLAPGVGHYPGAPVRYYWIDFDGVAGTVTAIISSTPNKPTPDATNSVSYTNASIIGTSGQLYFSEYCYLDHIRVAPTPIGSNPL